MAVPSVVCDTCGCILTFYSMNPFIVFTIIPKLHIGSDDLDKTYFTFQRQLHPDKLIGVSDKEKISAEQHISQINVAYKALKQPILIGKAAALYIKDPFLSLEKFDDKELPMPDKEFLQAVMLWQSTGTTEEINSFYNKLLSKLDIAIAELQRDNILKVIGELTYIERLRSLK